MSAVKVHEYGNKKKKSITFMEPYQKLVHAMLQNVQTETVDIQQAAAYKTLTTVENFFPAVMCIPGVSLQKTGLSEAVNFPFTQWEGALSLPDSSHKFAIEYSPDWHYPDFVDFTAAHNVVPECELHLQTIFDNVVEHYNIAGLISTFKLVAEHMLFPDILTVFDVKKLDVEELAEVLTTIWEFPSIWQTHWFKTKDFASSFNPLEYVRASKTALNNE